MDFDDIGVISKLSLSLEVPSGSEGILSLSFNQAALKITNPRYRYTLKSPNLSACDK